MIIKYKQNKNKPILHGIGSDVDLFGSSKKMASYICENYAHTRIQLENGENLEDCMRKVSRAQFIEICVYFDVHGIPLNYTKTPSKDTVKMADIPMGDIIRAGFKRHNAGNKFKNRVMQGMAKEQSFRNYVNGVK